MHFALDPGQGVEQQHCLVLIQPTMADQRVGHAPSGIAAFQPAVAADQAFAGELRGSAMALDARFTEQRRRVKLSVQHGQHAGDGFGLVTAVMSLEVGANLIALEPPDQNTVDHCQLGAGENGGVAVTRAALTVPQKMQIGGTGRTRRDQQAKGGQSVESSHRTALDCNPTG